MQTHTEPVRVASQLNQLRERHNAMWNERQLTGYHSER